MNVELLEYFATRRAKFLAIALAGNHFASHETKIEGEPENFSGACRGLFTLVPRVGDPSKSSLGYAPTSTKSWGRAEMLSLKKVLSLVLALTLLAFASPIHAGENDRL